MIKPKKWFLDHADLLATVFGAITGVAQLLIATEHINAKDGLLVGGLATIAWGVITNKKSPANRHTDFSHLGVSTSNSIDPTFAEAIEDQSPTSDSRNRANHIEQQRLGNRSTGMGDRVNPLDREEGSQDPEDRGL
jgi:hypothetical protein